MMNGMSTLEEATNAWFEAQRKLVEQWGNVVSSSMQATDNPAMEEGKQTTADTLQAMNDTGDSVTNMVAEQVVAGQAAMGKVLEMSANAWQAILPQMNGGDWQAALQQYTDQLRATLTQAPQQTLETTQSLGQLWQTWLQRSQQFGLPWFTAAQQSVGPWLQVASGDLSALNQVVGPYWQAYHQTIGRMLNTPAFGATREVSEEQAAAFNAWVEALQANSEFQIIVADVWVNAFSRFMETLVNKAQSDGMPTSAREFVNLWTDVAEEVFGDEFRSPRYVDAQGKLLNKTMEFQLRQRVLAERIARAWGAPTKTDIEEAHKSIYELRKELKAIKKAQQADQQAQRDDNADQLHAALDEIKEARDLVAQLQQTVGEMQAAQPDTETLMESLDDLRKEVKKLRKSLKDQDGDAPKKRGKKDDA